MKTDSRFRTSFRLQLRQSRAARGAIAAIALLALASALAPLLPHDPDAIDIAGRLASPGSAHWFGTDDMGRDYFTRALYGGRVSLTVGLLAMIISTTIGAAAGMVSGYCGGKTDGLLMRTADILLCLPAFFILMLANAYLKPGIIAIILIIGLFGWMDVARIIRAETLTLKRREFVLAAKLAGAGPRRIITRHILPNVMPLVIVASTINIANAILLESALSFLGLGVRQPAASWGSMLQNARAYIGDAPNLALFPGLMILLTVLSFNILGDILRRSLDAAE